MAIPTLVRLSQELAELNMNTISNVNAHGDDGSKSSFTLCPVSTDNMFVWKGTIMGPRESPYEGGLFYIRLEFPKDYPIKPPRIEFRTKIWHPNIYHGEVLTDFLCNQWRPEHGSIPKIITWLQELLITPEGADADAIESDGDCWDKSSAASDYFSKEKAERGRLFETMARAWTERYATAHKDPRKQEAIKRLSRKLALDEERCRQALEDYDFDETMALQSLYNTHYGC